MHFDGRTPCVRCEGHGSADIEKALDACEAKAEGQSAAAIENGKDYRCYMEKAVNMTSRSEVLK